MCNHYFVNENGYTVCSNCGIAENSHYWSKDPLFDAINRGFQPIPITNYQYGFVGDKRKWKRLMYLNKMCLKKNHHYITESILNISRQLPLSPEVKGKIFSYITGMEFDSYNEVCQTFYKLMCIHDLPITSKEFITILQADKKYKYKLMKKLKSVESTRKYYWYITKQIEKARKILNFSHEEGQEIHKIVLDYYNLIRFKMLKSSNPTYLIHNLVYYTVREKLRPNQQVFSKKSFGIKTLTYITHLVVILKKIKDLGLDSHFIGKLEISSRNNKRFI